VEEEAVEVVESEALAQALNLENTEVALTVKREDVSRIKGLKFSSSEVPTVEAFQDYLFHRGFIRKNSFAQLFIYIFNLAWTQHKQVVDAEAEEEEHGK